MSVPKAARRLHGYGGIGHGRPWPVFLLLQHFLQGGNFAIPANGRHLVWRIFYHCSVMLWNNLPSVVIMSPSIEVFKSRLADVTLMWTTD